MQAIDRRERLRRLALETIDLSKDPYFMRNHLGQYECRLCLTLHNNEGNYLAHTQVSLLNSSLQSSFLRMLVTFHSVCCMNTVWSRYETCATASKCHQPLHVPHDDFCHNIL